MLDLVLLTLGLSGLEKHGRDAYVSFPHGKEHSEKHGNSFIVRPPIHAPPAMIARISG